MSDQKMARPAVMESITESELQELEVRVADGHKAEFEEMGRLYGWDDDTVKEVWKWLSVQAENPQ